MDIVRHDLMKSVADAITNTQSFNDIQPELKDKKYMKGISWLQVRDITTDDNHEIAIKDRINETLGQYAKDELLCTILENRERDNTYADFGVNGNHSNNAFQSSNANLIRTLIIPEHIHKDWNDDEVEALGVYLNPRAKAPKKETNLPTIARLVFKEIERGLTYNSDIVKSIFDFNNLTKKEINKVKNLVSDMSGEDKNWINWNGSGYKKELSDYIDDLNNKQGVYAKQFSSGKNDLLTHGLVKLREKIKEGQKIDTYHIVIHHPTESYQKTWHKEYDTLNKDILKDIFDNATDNSTYKGINFIFEEMETQIDKWNIKDNE